MRRAQKQESSVTPSLLVTPNCTPCPVPGPSIGEPDMGSPPPMSGYEHQVLPMSGYSTLYASHQNATALGSFNHHPFSINTLIAGDPGEQHPQSQHALPHHAPPQHPPPQHPPPQYATPTFYPAMYKHQPAYVPLMEPEHDVGGAVTNADVVVNSGLETNQNSAYFKSYASTENM